MDGSTSKEVQMQEDGETLLRHISKKCATTKVEINGV